MQVPIRKPGKYTHAKSDPNLTPTKLAELQEKLRHLKKNIPAAAAEVKVLSEGGDFSENAGYSAAKWRLRGMNQAVIELEEQIKNARIIAPTENISTVQLGHRVTVEIAGQQRTYTILGSSETDPAAGIISHHSPIGAALLGHAVGETVTYTSAANLVECRIVKIE